MKTSTQKQINEQSVRKVSSHIKEQLNSLGISDNYIGYYYQVLHYIIILGGGFIILFNTNPYHLIVLLIIISLDAIANVVVHDCPLTALERKYMKKSLSHDRRKNMKKSNIMYKCNHVYESQVELIVNMWTLVACKIIIILTVRTFTPDLIRVCCGVQ